MTVMRPTSVPPIAQREVTRLPVHRAYGGHVLIAAAGACVAVLVLLAAFVVASGDAAKAAGATLAIIAFLLGVGVIAYAFNPGRSA